MAQASRVAVIDIGKTNAKLVVFDLASGTEIARRTTANRVLSAPPYRHFDTEGLWQFVLTSLGELHRSHGFDAISITTHGACFALVDEKGDLALPVMDYEDPLPDRFAADYDTIRPDFAETGSPRLPMGLNAAAMLFAQQRTEPESFSRVRAVLPWPQYFAFRLTGVQASEVTSLGTHTDLWNPHQKNWSSLVGRMGLDALMPPVRAAADVLGPVKADVAAAAGLPAGLPVHCGLHDSNASLLPHLLSRRAPFAVMSTGTWVVTLAVGAKDIPLDPSRDVLFNVNALSEKTPSARFMGGRAFEMLEADGRAEVTAADRARVLAEGLMILPSFPQGSGPFPHRLGSIDSRIRTAGERLYATSLYLALMGLTALDLIGAQGDLIVEGPFAENHHFLAALGALRGRMPFTGDGRLTGTSFGAACLAGPVGDLTLGLRGGEAVAEDVALTAYAQRWFSAVGAQ